MFLISKTETSTDLTMSRSFGITKIKPLCFFILGLCSSSFADTPLGWINSANPSAYTTTKGDLEIAIAGLAVNDTLDFLNIRDELLESNARLEGDSGDMAGGKLELHYGITETLSVFYKHQLQDVTVDLTEFSSINLIDIDDSLDSSLQSAGFKWTFFQGNLLNSDNRNSAASIELSGFKNQSDDFDILLDEIRLDNITIIFRDPQTFSVADLEDEGWKARAAYTFPMFSNGIGTFWAGFGATSATSATTTDITSNTIAKYFEQDFDLDEDYLYFGASLTLQITARMPLLLSYEYIDVRKSTLKSNPEVPLVDLPGFLDGSNQGGDSNHTIHARISYWLTPELNLSLTANLYSNQFLGVIPHYNNPLSGSFSSVAYGFVGLELAYNF